MLNHDPILHLLKKCMLIQIAAVLLLLATQCMASTKGKESETLNVLLYNESLEEQEKAYWHIVNNSSKFSDLIYQELTKWEKHKKKNIRSLNKLIYLATILREERFVSLLVKILETPSYYKEECRNDCPVRFSLVIYSCFTNYFKISQVNKRIPPVKGLQSDIDLVEFYVKKKPLKKEDASRYESFPGRPNYVSKLSSLTTAQLIELARPNNTDLYSREAATIVLPYSITTTKHRLELYWLAVQEILMEGPNDDRFALYLAIYKAEKAKEQQDNK